MMRNLSIHTVVRCRSLRRCVVVWCAISMVAPFNLVAHAAPDAIAYVPFPTDQSKLEAAAEAMREARFDKAIELYNAAVADTPGDAHPYLARGWALACVGQNDSAITDLSKAIAIAPDDADAYQRRGNVFSAAGDSANALADFEAFVKRRPDDSAGYRDRALAHAEMKHFDASLADFARAIALSPKDATLLVARAGVLGRVGKIGLAMADYDAAVKLEPGNGTLLLARARVAASRGKQPDAAIADLKRVIALGHDSAEVQSLLGDAYRSKGDTAGAAIQDGNAALLKNDPAGALKCFEIVAPPMKEVPPQPQTPPQKSGRRGGTGAPKPPAPPKSGPHTVEALIGIGRAQRTLGEKITQVDQFGFNQEQHDIYYTSMGALNRALEIEPKNAAALTELGWTYYRLEDVRDADRYLKEAIAAEPTLALAHLRLGASNLYKFTWNKKRNLQPDDRAGRFFKGGTLEGAESELLAAVKYDPTLTDAYTLIGQLHAVNGDDQRAIDAYTTAINADPANDNAYMNRGLCYKRLNNLDAAVTDANRAVSIAPMKASSFWYRALILRAAGQESQACVDFLRAQKLDGTYTDPQAVAMASSGQGLTTGQKWAIGIGVVFAGALMFDLLSGSHNHNGAPVANGTSHTGRRRCDACGGSGKQSCWACSGMTRVPNLMNPNQYQSCGSCMGSGRVSCSSCSGGYVY